MPSCSRASAPRPATPAAARFSRLLAGDPGIDPYTRQTSDVYHDVFAQGSFIGKGIYDVRAFAAALEGRFPDNRVLSHDLIEGCYARSGLVNDVELFEGLPSRFLAEMGRRHRWIRGDWQIASWLCKRVPTARGMASNPLDGWRGGRFSTISAAASCRRCCWGFCLPAGSLLRIWPAIGRSWPCCWRAARPLAGCLPGCLRKPREKPWSLHVKDQGARVLKVFCAEAFSWCVLPYAAQRHVDAVVRTLFRLGISHRGLLEWVTASDAEARCPTRCRDHYAAMWACAAAGAAVMALLALEDPRALWWAGPLLLAWLAGPLVAWWSSQPCRRWDASLRKVPQRQVRRWARQTWHYFETFANAREHWLPPDNVQSHSPLAVATRTSPTNIGMGLLSALAAYDLGYLSATALIERTEGVCTPCAAWNAAAGTSTTGTTPAVFEPVEPRYVSSVDSGNLWGALTVLAAGLDELRDRPVVPPRFLEGLQDTLEAMAVLRAHGWPGAAFDDPLDECLEQLRRQCAGPSPTSARSRARTAVPDSRTGCHAGDLRRRGLSGFAVVGERPSCSRQPRSTRKCCVGPSGSACRCATPLTRLSLATGWERSRG